MWCLGVELAVEWYIRLEDYGVVYIDKDELFKLSINPLGRSEVVFYMAVFVRDVLKIVRKRYIRSYYSHNPLVLLHITPCK
jgi:hypothetical protein